jgi:hypothetical protein
MHLFHSGQRKRAFFGASALSIARYAALTPTVWLTTLLDLVWPTSPGTDHFHMPSMPWTTLYCCPRYSIAYTLTDLWGRSAGPSIVLADCPRLQAAM